MNTSNFLDANVWLALIWSRHVHSQKARRWFQEADGHQFFFCRFTQITVLRLLTNQSIMGDDIKTMSEAWAVWDELWADSSIAMLQEPEDLEKDFRAQSRLNTPSPKVWADAYLLAFAMAANVKLITFDRSLQGRGADVLVL